MPGACCRYRKFMCVPSCNHNMANAKVFAKSRVRTLANAKHLHKRTERDVGRRVGKMTQQQSDNSNKSEGINTMSQMDTNRRGNLKRVVDELGGPTAVAKRLKLSGPSWLAQIMSGHRPFTEKTARKFEKMLGLKVNSLDLPDHYTAESVKPVIVNRDVPQVIDTINVIQSLLATRNQTLTQVKFGQVVDAVFSHVLKTGKVDPNLVEKILDLLV